MKLIIGLGNPGLRYGNTRHNIGFMVVKALSKRLKIPVRRRVFKGLFGIGVFFGEKLGLFMPQTYMNLSGEAVREIVKKEKAGPSNILVIYDDIDLRLGFLRLRKDGSAGGHKGVSSIIEHLETNEFPRLRVGISRETKAGDVSRFVLTPFDSSEKRLLKEAVESATECALAWLKEGPDAAMTRFNRRQAN